MVNIKNVPKI